MNLELKEQRWGMQEVATQAEFIGPQRSKEDSKGRWGQATQGTTRVQVREFIPRLLRKCSRGRQRCLKCLSALQAEAWQPNLPDHVHLGQLVTEEYITMCGGEHICVCGFSKYIAHCQV